MYNYLYTIAYVVILNSIYVLISLYAWYHLWVKKLGVEIPIERKFEGLEKRQLYYSTTSPSILFEFFKTVLYKFDREYWSTHCGQDAYLYLLFQRKLLKQVSIMAVGTLIISFGINLFLANDSDEWFEKSTLKNQTITHITAWIHSLLTVAFTILTFHTVFELREEAKQLYKEASKEKCKNQDIEWLRARTLHIRGLLPKDRRGDMLRNELNLILKPVNGRVLDVVVIPDFQNLFDLEVEKKDLEDLNVLVHAQGPPKPMTRCCIRALHTRAFTTLEERQRELELEIDQEIQKPFLSSGHAFVVVDSVHSLNHCLKQSQLSPTYAWRLTKATIKETIEHFFKKKTNKDEPTFNQFVDEDMEIAKGMRDKDLTLVMHEAGDPVDIIWRNLGGTRGVYILRKLLFNLIGLVIVFYLSTPAAIYSSLKMLQAFKFLDFTPENGEQTWLSTLIQVYMPPMVIIFINNILLYGIDYSAYYEKRVTHSKYQQSIFNKAYVYLALNTLIIPAVTLTSQMSIIKVAMKNNYNIFTILAQFYTTTDSGVFFVSIMISTASLSLCTSLIRPGEISYSFFSPWLAHYKRKYINDQSAWRRKEGQTFLYGFCYAQCLVIVTMVMIFSSQIPLVAMAGVLFFIARHSVDAYNLLTMNKKEINSSSQMFRKILLHFQFGIILLHLCMISYLAIESYTSCAAFLGVSLLVSSVLVIFTNKSLFDIAKQDPRIFNEEVNMDVLDEEELRSEDNQLHYPLMKWRQEYSHPLSLVSNAVEVKHLSPPKEKLVELKFDNEFTQRRNTQVDEDQKLKEMIFTSNPLDLGTTRPQSQGSFRKGSQMSVGQFTGTVQRNQLNPFILEMDYCGQKSGSAYEISEVGHTTRNEEYYNDTGATNVQKMILSKYEENSTQDYISGVSQQKD